MSTSINWPSSLPGFPINSWSHNRGTAMLKTDMEVGPPKRRLRSTTPLTKLSGTLELDETQFGTFRTFIETTLVYGTLSFNFPDYINSTTMEVVLDINTGGDLYGITQSGNHTYKIDLKLEEVPS